MDGVAVVIRLRHVLGWWSEDGGPPTEHPRTQDRVGADARPDPRGQARLSYVRPTRVLQSSPSVHRHVHGQCRRHGREGSPSGGDEAYRRQRSRDPSVVGLGRPLAARGSSDVRNQPDDSRVHRSRWDLGTGCVPPRSVLRLWVRQDVVVKENLWRPVPQPRSRATRPRKEATSMKAWSLTTGSPPRSFSTGRRCQREGCDTILSRYTPGPLCRAHTGPRPFVGNRARGRR
jgi:hypothetical protein